MMAAHNRSDAETERRVVEAYGRGDLVRDIAGETGLDWRTVYAILDRHDVGLRRKSRLTLAQLDSARRYVGADGTVADLARYLGRARGTILRSLAEHYGIVPDGVSPDELARWRAMSVDGMSVATIATAERRATSIVAAALIADGTITRLGGAGTHEYR